MAGLSENDRKTIKFLLENINDVIFIAADGHPKDFIYENANPGRIIITVEILLIILPPGTLDQVHASAVILYLRKAGSAGKQKNGCHSLINCFEVRFLNRDNLVANLTFQRRFRMVFGKKCLFLNH